MNKTVKNIIVVACFLTVLFGFGLGSIIKADEAISFNERRKLAQFPTFTLDKLTDGEYFDELEDYFLDQFLGRDFFRSTKAYFKKYLAFQKDNNGVFSASGHLFALGYNLNEKSVLNAANKFNAISDKYLQNLNVYYSIIADKNYYLDDGYLKLDYEKLAETLSENVSGMTYIDIFNLLTLDDYYSTDLHWSQDKLLELADAILKALGINEKISENSYEYNSLKNFYGSYFGQSALGGKADTLIYLTNAVLSGCTVYDYETGKTTGVYDPSLIDSVDGYSVFLNGAKALLRIDNPYQNNGKTLYIFRDSFSSSLAPLLAQQYETVYLIDLRYISSDILGQYITFTDGADALFMYSAQLINGSQILK